MAENHHPSCLHPTSEWHMSCMHEANSSWDCVLLPCSRFFVSLFFLVGFIFLAISGGQKSRVAFAKITFRKPHIILLDEPSNHLVTGILPFIIPFVLHLKKIKL